VRAVRHGAKQLVSEAGGVPLTACESYCSDSKRKLPIGKTHNLKTEATNPKKFFQKVFAERMNLGFA